MTYLDVPARRRSEIHGIGNWRRLGSKACPDVASSDEIVGKVIFGFSSVGFDRASRLGVVVSSSTFRLGSLATIAAFMVWLGAN